MSANALLIARPMTLLRLGRVSNLPTVWTNVIAGGTIASDAPPVGRVVVAALAMTAFYVGGMYLNDYFDRDIDARERPERPICAGEIDATAVSAIGFGLLALGVVLLSAYGAVALAAALALAGAVALYDLWHKGNVFGPVIMSACRALVYLGTGAAVGHINGALVVWSLVLAAHVAGLTYAAKQESLNRVGRLWPLAILAVPLLAGLAGSGEGWRVGAALALLAGADGFAVWLLAARPARGAVPRAVSTLIAAICLVDALAVAAAGGGVALVVVCAAGYALTRVFQTVVPGT